MQFFLNINWQKILSNNIGEVDKKGGKIFLDDDSCVRMMAFWKVCEERFYDLGDLLQSSFTSVCSGHKREKAIGDTFKINCSFIRENFFLFTSFQKS